MSLEVVAKKLAAKGRHGDDVLVHMTRGEVAGLQALAKANGTSMTVNPSTGMPEAFSLKSLLPAIAGAAMTYFSGGVINPYVSAGIMGLGTAATGGSMSDALKAGIGAYGGASFGAGAADSAATSMGEGSASDAAAQQASANVAAQGGSPAAAGTNQAAAQQVGSENFANASMGERASALGDISAQGVEQGMAEYASPAKAGLMALTPVLTETPERKAPPKIKMSRRPYSLTRERLESTPENSSERLQVRDTWIAGPVQALAGGGIAQLAGGGMTHAWDPATGKYIKLGGGDDVKFTFDPTTSQYTETRRTPVYDIVVNTDDGGWMTSTNTLTGYTDPVTRILGGGAPQGAGGQQPGQGGQSGGGGAGGGAGAGGVSGAPGLGGYRPEQVYGATTPQAYKPEHTYKAAQGGAVSGHLGSYSDGGRLLRGPGDGVSDSIPASINGKQPARLADGEFVVPARIVSELGNGSTEAGAKKLYDMMERVQRARSKTTGKNRVATNSRADKFLPA